MFPLCGYLAFERNAGSWYALWPRWRAEVWCLRVAALWCPAPWALLGPPRACASLMPTAAAQSEHTPSWGVWTFPKAQAFWHLAAALRLFGRCVSLALRRVVGAWPCSVCVSVV